MSRVAIVEDHELLAETLASALQRNGIDARIVLTGDGPLVTTDLLGDVLATPVDLVLLDLDLGALGDSTDLIPDLVSAGVRVLVVTGAEDPMRIAAALDQGAVGYQHKSAGLAPLIDRVRAALASPAPLDAVHRLSLLDGLRRHRLARRTLLAPFERLTEREAQTLRALAGGRSVASIATEWRVSDATVRSHVRAILGKLDVGSQLAAVALALRSDWLTAPPVRQSASLR
jgi:two-component system nitrate/nitrite response regulator NarL